MPVHDWTRVDAGIFHAFHHGWIGAISNALNEGLLPPDYYALPEQHAAGFGPDVLALQSPHEPEDDGGTEASGGGLLIAKPALTPTAETDMEYYRRKQNLIAVRHVSGDRVVAMVEIISPGNKSARHAIRALLDKAAQLLDQRIHLLLIDLFPPGPRDPHGLHAALWEEITGQEPTPTANKPVKLVAYESALTIRAYVREIAVGEALPAMPLFLEPGAYVMTPLEATYQAALRDAAAVAGGVGRLRGARSRRIMASSRWIRLVKLLNSVPIKENKYFDRDAPRGTVYYRIVAVTETGERRGAEVSARTKLMIESGH